MGKAYAVDSRCGMTGALAALAGLRRSVLGERLFPNFAENSWKLLPIGNIGSDQGVYA